MPVGVVDTTELEIGPANVYLEEDGVDVYLGGTGVIEFEVQEDWDGMTTEQTGSRPVNKVLSGTESYLTVPLRQINHENINRALASVKLIVGSGADAGKKRVEHRAQAGIDLYTLAKKLTIKPIIGGAETVEADGKWIVAKYAAPATDSVKIQFAARGQREFTARFQMLPDSAKNNRTWYMGDDSIVTSTEKN